MVKMLLLKRRLRDGRKSGEGETMSGASYSRLRSIDGYIDRLEYTPIHGMIDRQNRSTGELIDYFKQPFMLTNDTIGHLSKCCSIH